MRDAMIDLETFGNGKDACVVQIGACFFDRNTGDIGKTFKVNIDARSAVLSGAVIDADTVYWWLSQEKLAIESILADPKKSITPAFIQLNEFLKGVECLWSHATFDFVIIMETFKRLNIKPSFPYRAARDIRTLNDLGGEYGPPTPRMGVHHDALDDALYQVSYCVPMIQALKKRVESSK